MNVFIVSNSSYIDTIALISTEYIINSKDLKFCVLSENHDNAEKEIVNNKRVKICDNINEAIKYCDITLLYLDDSFSEEKKQQIINLCIQHNKPFYKIVFPEDVSLIRQPNIEMNHSDIPALLSLSIGKYHYQHRTELIISDIFKKDDIGVKQLFTELSYQLIDQYETAMGIEMQKPCNNPKVQIYSRSYHNLNDLLSDTNLYDELNLLNLVVVIVDIESSFSSIENLVNLFRYRFGYEIDLCIRSNYAQISSGAKGIYKPIYYSSDKECSSNNEYIDYFDVYKNIYHTILSKLAFPQGIKFINAL